MYMFMKVDIYKYMYNHKETCIFLDHQLTW